MRARTTVLKLRSISAAVCMEQVYDIARLLLALWDRFGLEAISLSQLPMIPNEQVQYYDVTGAELPEAPSSCASPGF